LNQELENSIGGGAGGAAGEQGSLHRSGVAAFLAVHGLVGAQVGGRTGAVPVRIHLEAPEAVDDIVCTMRDGSTWYIQAKRTAGMDSALRATIRQWVAQDLRPADRVVLASRVFRGPLRSIQPVIDSLVGQRGAPIGTGAQADIDTFTGLLTEGGSVDGSALLKHVVLLSCAAEGPADHQQALAIAMLADTLVDAQDALASFEALRNQMQRWAARREWSHATDWIDAIRGGAVRVYADASGAPGARIEADRHALASYRTSVSRALDTLDLSAIHPRLGRVRVESLLDGWDVVVEGEPATARFAPRSGLWSTVRRNSRFILTGLSGIGKSEALRQIAARMAADPEAPVPIHVDLRGILTAIRQADDVTLDLLLSQSARVTSDIDPATMADVLRKTVMAGSAVLVIDGLDEARHRRGAVALGLSELLSHLPASTGLVLSSRPSALDTVAVMGGIELVRLQSPSSLKVSLAAILRAMSEQIEISAREAWLDERLLLLERNSKDSEEIWKVPLLASLATVRIGRDRHLSPTPAALLNEVIADSVRSWEQFKTTHSDGFDEEMRAGMLMDGFVAIGRLLNDSGIVPVEEGIVAVTKALSRWAYSPPLTEILAGQVLHFWDERVGVFVEQDGDLIARSRQFAEIADVAWVRSQSHESKQAWVASALAEADRKHTVQLATAGDSLIRAALLDFGRRGTSADLRGRAIDWVADMWGSWNEIDDNTAVSIIGVLADAAEDMLPAPQRGEGIIRRAAHRARERRDGEGWHCVISLARADLSGVPSATRYDRLLSLDLSEQRRSLIDLLMGLRAARREQRALTAHERAGIESMLQGDRPAATVTTRADGVLKFEQAERFTTGVADVIELALNHVDELSPDAPEAFFSLARDFPMAVYENIVSTLRQKGFIDPKPWAILEMMAAWQEEFKDFQGTGWLLRQISKMYPENVTATVVEMWRTEQLATFLAVLKWGEASVPDWRAAADESPERLSSWFDASINAHGLLGPVIATQARLILADPIGRESSIDVIQTRPLGPLPEAQQIDCHKAAAVAQNFTSDSTWIAEQSLDLVLAAKCPDVASTIGSLSGPWTWRSLFLATIAALANADDPEEWITRAATGDSAQRAGLALMLPQLDWDRGDWAEMLPHDEDATVRHYAQGTIDGATVWTCTWCFKLRGMSEVQCGTCHQHPVWTKS